MLLSIISALKLKPFIELYCLPFKRLCSPSYPLNIQRPVKLYAFATSIDPPLYPLWLHEILVLLVQKNDIHTHQTKTSERSGCATLAPDLDLISNQEPRNVNSSLPI